MVYSVQEKEDLVKWLCQQPRETEWLEFKHNNADPSQIGEYISALSNSAALEGRASGYMIWGIEDQTHDIVGTHFSPSTAQRGGEELENWLSHSIVPNIVFAFDELIIDNKEVVLLTIERAIRQPTSFNGEEFVRIGSYKKRLKDHVAREKQLWQLFDAKPFEDLPATDPIEDHRVFELLDCNAYFSLTKQPKPTSNQGILEALASERLIQPSDSGKWHISNLGAILFAQDLNDFSKLSRKEVRVIQYKDDTRVKSFPEHISKAGYACGFADLINYITSKLPPNEEIKKAFRENSPVFPELAIRELVANALIHQDFSLTGTGPMVEIFRSRMEIANPGEPLIDTERFLDSAPRSKNEALASLMRRMGICEERGSGIDKVVFETEFYQLPAPKFIAENNATRATLFTYRSLKNMDPEDRVRACYLHSCLKYVNNEHMTNASLRGRFKIKQENYTMASRFIREALDAGAIKPYNESTSKKLMRYIPHWA